MVYIKKYIVSLSVISSFLAAMALSSCSDKEVEEIVKPDYEKNPIDLTVGLADADFGTRAITNGTGKTLSPFTSPTRLFFIVDAVKEDGQNVSSKYGLNYATAAAGVTGTDYSTITYSNNYLYWDDAFGRDSKISIYSVASANNERSSFSFSAGSTTLSSLGTDTDSKAIFPFAASAPDDYTFSWSVGEQTSSTFKQTKTTIESQDLVYSNNISKYDGTDNRLSFKLNSETGKSEFEKGKLIYYHALSKITIKLKAGEGFTVDGNDFQFADGSNVALNGFYGSGTFSLKKGEFTGKTQKNYTSIYCSNTTKQLASAGAYYTLEAYLVPGTDLTSDVANALSFTIDDNEYKVPMATLQKALKEKSENVENEKIKASVLKDEKEMLPGVNYTFSFTVGKKQINNITAQIMDWENVYASDYSASNARIKVKLEERGTEVKSGIQLYRTAEKASTITDDITTETSKGYVWTTGYSAEDNGLTYPSGGTNWTTNWYWPNNQTFYHLRAVSPVGTTVKPADAGDYFEISNIQPSTDADIDAVAWGAPFLDDKEDDEPGTIQFKYGKNTNGFDGADGATNHQIYMAIGPTKDPIKLLMFHMLSNVTIRVKTVTGDGAVELTKTIDGESGTTTKYCDITFKQIVKKGTVLMGNGLVTPSAESSDCGDYTFTVAPTKVTETVNEINTDYWTWNYGAVPQDLSGVELVITTPDGNQFKIGMKDLVAASFGTTGKSGTWNIENPYGSDKKIDRWYPNFKYTYTFTLEKNKLPAITVTILDWEEVTVNYDEPIKIQ